MHFPGKLASPNEIILILIKWKMQLEERRKRYFNKIRIYWLDNKAFLT